MGRTERNILRTLLVPLYEVDQPLVLPDDVTDNQVLAVARHHRLSPALSVLAEGSVSPDLLERFCRDRLVTLGRGTLLRHALVEVVNALHASGVKTIVLKGMAYEDLVYPIPGTRPATDVDILVRRDCRDATFQTFRSLGFQPVAAAPGFDERDYHEISLRRGDVNLDLHFGLAPFVRGAVDYDALWADAVPLPMGGAPAFGLSRPHAALHQALHMAIHHFDVPGIYLLDLARLTTAPEIAGQATQAARQWRCLRAWETGARLAAAFIPAAASWLLPAGPASSPRIDRVIQSYGRLAALPRAEQLRRKLEHFDSAADAARYLAVQGRRILREKLIQLTGEPSAAERLGW